MFKPRFTIIAATITTILLLSIATSCNNADHPALIHAAASLVDVLTEISTQYEDETDNHVRFNFAGSNLIANQIVTGAPADAVILAGKTPIDKLIQAEKTTQSETIQILSNTLVAVRSANSNASHQHPAQLVGAGKIAMPDPKTAPAGEYFQAALRELDILDQIQPQIVPTINVRAALAAAASGNVAYALVYRTDAISTDDVQIAFTFQTQSEAVTPRYFASIINENNGRRKRLPRLSAITHSSHNLRQTRIRTIDRYTLPSRQCLTPHYYPSRPRSSQRSVCPYPRS